MMELNVSKRKMLRLIRACRHRMDEPIPIPSVKECRLYRDQDGVWDFTWKNGVLMYKFTLMEYDNLFFLNAAIFVLGAMFQGFALPLDRDRLVDLGILTDREEGLVCQG